MVKYRFFLTNCYVERNETIKIKNISTMLLRKIMKSEKSLYGYLGKKSMKEILEGLRDEEEKI